MSALFVEQLTTIDFSYLCPERGLTGETWLVDVTLSGELNDEGMVFDFGHVKKEIKAMIDAYADHALLVPVQNSAITITNDDSMREVHLQQEDGRQTRCRAPLAAILPLPVTSITPEQVQPLLEKHIMQGLPENVTSIEMSLYPQNIQGAYYHYSHGLKKHSGDCQRIAHGHRSQIKIYLNNNRREDLEQELAREWKDIYLATREDITEEGQIISGHPHYTFAYEAIQGHFELQIPAHQCYLMDTDTTVELIADHLAGRLAKQYNQPIKVIANEGFCKGAIGVS